MRLRIAVPLALAAALAVFAADLYSIAAAAAARVVDSYLVMLVDAAGAVMACF